MCGIAGILKLSDKDIHLPSVIQQMTYAIKHRGPDDEGFVLFNKEESITAGSKDTQATAWNREFKYSAKEPIESLNNSYSLAFGHRRLSVIDLSEYAHQPMCNEDADVWITLNGEIYNYIEIQNELKELGHHFISQSDTEVLLKAYEVWGFDCLNHLNGMFSFVIYDKNKNILFGARDRFGVKPLYYYKDENVFAFASEHKALLKIPDINTGVNESAVFEHLFLNQVELEAESFFKNIYELQPAHSFTIDINTGAFTINRYYQLDYNTQKTSFDEQSFVDLVNNTKKLMYEAVDIRLRSDIPIGFCLSGGLDSSSIVCMASDINKKKAVNNLGEHLTAFTATNQLKETNEEAWAEMVVDKTGANWIKASCTADDMMKELENIIYHQDIPLLSTSTYAQYKVMQAAGQSGIHILIDGQGGDELFAGYAPFFSAYYAELIQTMDLSSFINEIKNIDNSPTTIEVFIKSLFKSGIDKVLATGISKKYFSQLFKGETSYLNDEFLNKYQHKIKFAGDYQITGVNKLLHYFFTQHYLKNLLRWEDRCSMAFSVESRTPFSDDINLIEYLFSLPSAYKIHNGWSKYLLRTAMNGVLPDAIKNRKDKMGFSTPQYLWLKEINQQMKQKIIELKGDDKLVDADKLLNDWDMIFSNPTDKRQDFAFRYMCYLIWKNLFFKD
ncbi:MAG: asparagine synthase (glutamine-hydrolyzing) [Bacteroidota bacterium]